MKLTWRRHPGYGNTKDSHVVGGGSFLATLWIEALQPGPVSVIVIHECSEKLLRRKGDRSLGKWERRHHCTEGTAIGTILPIT